MLHNQPYNLSKVIVERNLSNVLKQTYSRIDGLEAKMRENIANVIEKFAQDPADALSWNAESVVNSQTKLSILLEIRGVLNGSNMDTVTENFAAFERRYKEQIIAWTTHGENSSSMSSNLVSRANLAASAEMFGSWGLSNEIERTIANDIEESQKRVVVLEFLELKVDQCFRTLPDLSTTLYRKLTPLKAAECIYPVTKERTHRFEKRTTVYVFRVPTENDVLYQEDAAA